MGGDGLRRSIASRSSRLLGMAAKLAGHEARHALARSMTSSLESMASAELKARIAQAKVLAEGLGQLKGAAMKAGQLLSIDAGDLLPPEAVEILSKLQGKAEPVPFAVVRAVLEAELGPAYARLEALEPEPAAAASIGQVHRARVDGQPVAVKVQYPGIAETIDSDLELLEKLAGSWLAITRGKFELDAVFEEVRATLHLEADYARERAHLEEYAQLVGDDPRFRVPDVERALCTPKVLTMSWEDGVPLGAWVRSEPPREARERLARAVLDLYCREFFDWGFVQTDPNHGNFLVRPETGQLVLLDFGATLRFDAPFRGAYVELLRRVARRERAGAIALAYELELIDPREAEETKGAFLAMLESAREPFDAANQPFRFRDPDYAARSREVALRFVRGLRYSPPPRRLLFLHRKLGGIFQLLKRLEVTLDLGPYWARMVEGRPSTPRARPLEPVSPAA